MHAVFYCKTVEAAYCDIFNNSMKVAAAWKKERTELMRVMTLNTHSWMESKPLEKLEVLTKVILEKDYDLIALQEVNQLTSSETVETDAYFDTGALAEYTIHEDNFAFLLAEKLKTAGTFYYWSWMPVHLGYGQYHEGLALFSKVPVKAQGAIVSKEKEFSDYRTRKLLLGRTVLDGQEILAICCHYSWWSEETAKGFQYEWGQTLKLLDKIKCPKLLLGDFNNPAEYQQEGYELVTKSFLDSYAAADTTNSGFTVSKAIDGWSGNQQQLRMDYIFNDENFYAEACEVLFDGRGTPIISDHYGVEAELFFSELIEKENNTVKAEAESLY
ncbi:endonuclease/exonuclease/phosphatase family protein [Enterococcus sp. BWT-B8]|uniref:endonuclease/exonuclease/phosphatase family protein n=1 Tax=unclassified Enterococcus TaxID=2608891 RepID=UPI001E593918|nr:MULTISPECIES: endonuclease/exonuclease/phosphatase family protein [unclassified Enterococcus]MCB5951099.1 endonuclease/exonuclease/phosphatase family protein [Enterococcus sp. BWT-B8]